MKLSKVTISLGMVALVMSGSVMAAKATDSTTVKFTGTITETPCSLDSGSDKQEVKLGHVAAHVLKDNGKSSSQPFQFELKDCDVSTLKNVSVTFSGTADSEDPSLLALTGDASGAGIGITQGDTPITLGKPTAQQALQEGANTLQFAAYLKGDGASAVVPGNFESISNVTFTYQ